MRRDDDVDKLVDVVKGWAELTALVVPAEVLSVLVSVWLVSVWVAVLAVATIAVAIGGAGEVMSLS